MNYADERYVRLFTRDTATWKSWSWEARSLFMMMLRKVDRAGVIDTGKLEKTHAIALICECPKEVVEKGLPELVESETVTIAATAVLMPKFIEAQEGKQTDAARQRESREKRAAVAASTRIHEPVSHSLSQPVTDGHSSRAVPCRAEPSVPVEERPPPKELVPVVFQKPTADPLTWTGEDFFQWAQWRRQEAGFVGEIRRPKGLGSWWSRAMMTLGSDIERMQEAFYRFGESPHWLKATPPLPFAAFVAQWDQFVPKAATS